jgi:hypothetical protein
MRSQMILWFLCLTLLSSSIGACASAPAYAPQMGDAVIGYSDQQLGSGRYRVTFAGDAEDTREQVENFLLRRAAEVTLAAGYTHFVVDKENTERKVSHHTIYDMSAHPLGWGAQVNTRPDSRAWMRSNWQSHYVVPRAGAEVTRYIASSEIVMLSAEEIARNPNAISAREVLDRAARPGA